MCFCEFVGGDVGEDGVLDELNQPNQPCHGETGEQMDNRNGVGHFGLEWVLCSMLGKRVKREERSISTRSFALPSYPFSLLRMQLYPSEPRATTPLLMKKQRIVWMAVLLLIGLGVRLLGLELQPLWWDEGFSVYFATESTPRLLELTSLDIHPPIYYLLLQGWYQLVGVGALQSRWLSVLLGVLAIPLVWRVAYDFFGNRTAWLTALLLTLSPFHIYYSQEVRMYALMVVLSLIAVIAWRRRKWIILGIAVLGGLLTQYYFVFLGVAIGLLVLWELRHKRYGWRGPLMALGTAVLGYMPWLLYALPRLINYVGGKLVVEADTPMTPLEFLPRHLAAWSVGHLSVPMTALGWVAIVYLVLIGVSLYYARLQRSTQSVIYTLLLWLIPTLGIFGVGLFAPFTDARIERQLLFVLPFFLMLAASGIAYLGQRFRGAGVSVVVGMIVISVIALSDFYTVPRYPGEDYRPLLADVDALQGPDDGWLAIYEWQIGYLRAYLPDAEPEAVALDVTWAEDSIALSQGIDTLLQQYPRLWLPAYQVKGRIFEEQVAITLAEQGLPVWNEWYGNTRLYLFGEGPATSTTELPTHGEYERVGTIAGVVGSDRAISGTGVIPVYIQTISSAENVRVNFQVVGKGSVWGEWDGVYESDRLKAGILIIAGTPPGAYDVYAMLYDENNNAPLQRTQNGMFQAPELLLGTVMIERPPQPLSIKSLQRLATRRDDMIVGNHVQWVGVALPDAPLLQGDSLPVTLLWQSVQPASNDVRVFIQGFNEQGELKINHEIAPVNGTFPLPQWQAGDLVRDPHRVQLPPDLTAGRYQLVAGMYDPTTGQRFMTENGQDRVELGAIEVLERERVMEAPRIGETVSYPFGGGAELVQVGIEGFLVPNQPTQVTLVWKSNQIGGTPLRAFVQLFNGDQQLAVSDHLLEPPATAWIVGEYIIDRHTITLPSDLPAGEYRLIAGLVDDTSDLPITTTEGASFVEIRREIYEP
jgi:4-amino-4-deoxy-L-arabinose transferase-like glycosyltransferase